MKTILVGIDGSEQGWAALARAGELARATGASLQIAHITPTISPLAAEEYQTSVGGWVEGQDSYSRGLLREALTRTKDFDVLVEPLSQAGSPAEALAELAQAKSVTMAVVGHRGRNLAARLFVGSVADRLVQISPKPVLVVR